MEGLPQEAICPRTDRNNAAVCIVEGRNDNNGRGPKIWIRAHHSAELKPGWLRHHQVKQDEVRLDFTGYRHGFGTVVHNDRFITGGKQNHFNQIGRAFVVIYDEYLCHGFFLDACAFCSRCS